MKDSDYKLVGTASRKTSKVGKKKPEQQFMHKLTLDEYDELTFENQILGAKIERGHIVAELRRKASQANELYEAAPLGSELARQLSDLIRGLQTAVKLIESLRSYEDNVGCAECEVF